MTMTDEQKKMIDKVTKLLSLAEGTNHSQEAESARRMAVELMAKYNISLSNRLDPQDNGVVNEELDEYNSKDHYLHLMNAVAKFCDIFAITVMKPNGRKFLRYVGNLSALSTFEYMKDIVERQRNSAWAAHASDPRFSHETYSDQKRNQWYLGYAYGVTSKVAELIRMRNQKIQEWGLVPVSALKKAEQWYKDTFNANIRKGRPTDSKFLESGYASGKQVSLNRAVPNGGSGTSPKALN